MMHVSDQIPHHFIQETGSEARILHPALVENHDPDPSIFETYFDWVFTHDPRFESWQRDGNRWMLRCCGKPGSGKTTLSSLIVKRLRSKYTNQRDAVASIFICSDVHFNTSFFVEDFLRSIFRQFCASKTEIEMDAPYVVQYKAYLEASTLQHRDIVRISLIRNALDSRIKTLDHKFLVIDDFDRCYPAIDLLLEHELVRLQELGLKIMITSRIPCLNKTPMMHSCDACPPNPFAFLSVYWQCQTCEGVPFELCETCKEQGKGCNKCGDKAVFIQPYNHVDLDLSTEQLGQGWMEQFIDWKLENEHGALTLENRRSNSRIPPHSTIGAILASPGGSTLLQSLRNNLLDQARDNIALALTRIDLIRDANSLQSIDSVTDRLPSAVVAFFDAALERVGQQPETQRDLGIAAIAVVSCFPFHQGASFAVFKRMIAKLGRITGKESLSHRSIEEVLHAAKGFITIEPFQHRPLKAYCRDFHLYVSEDYNESLMWARSQMRLEEGLSITKRAQTFQPTITRRDTGRRAEEMSKNKLPRHMEY